MSSLHRVWLRDCSDITVNDSFPRFWRDLFQSVDIDALRADVKVMV